MFKFLWAIHDGTAISSLIAMLKQMDFEVTLEHKLFPTVLAFIPYPHTVDIGMMTQYTGSAKELATFHTSNSPVLLPVMTVQGFDTVILVGTSSAFESSCNFLFGPSDNILCHL